MILDPILDLFRGKAVTIPPLDGAFRPNTRLDNAPLFASLPEPDNLVNRHGELLVSSGNAVYSLREGEELQLHEAFASVVTALAASPTGEVAAGLESGRLVIDGSDVELPAAVRCITALAYGKDGALWLANGSASHAPSAWSADLMEKGASGSIWKREAAGGPFRQVAGGLAYPSGLLVEAGDVVVSESWRHRLIGIDGSGRQSVIADHLPGYPSRLSATADGGGWLAVFAPRNRLIEFILQEKHYREDMMATVPREHWIAPSLSSGRSFLEPLQCGGIRMMGVFKPWSPSRSYGLAVRLDARMQPVASFHSRANGTRHGTTSVLEYYGKLLVASKGGDCVVSIDLDKEF